MGLVHRLSNSAELAAHRAWKLEASDLRFGLCQGCNRVRDNDDYPLLVGLFRRGWRCLDCWDAGV